MTTANTVRINAYTYDQLDEAAQDRVRIWINEDDNWWCEDIIDWRKEEANKRGAYIDAIYFCASHSQGDYAAMHGQVDVIEWLCASDDASEVELGQRLQSYRDRDLIWDDMATLRDSRGWQDITCRLQGIDTDYITEEDGVSPEQFDRDLEQAEHLFDQSIRDFNHKTLQMLYDELDYLYSDEYVREMCEANGYLFNEHGDPIHHLAIA